MALLEGPLEVYGPLQKGPLDLKNEVLFAEQNEGQGFKKWTKKSVAWKMAVGLEVMLKDKGAALIKALLALRPWA